MFKLNHIGLAVTDMSRSAKFYADCLDFTAGRQYAGQDLKLLLLKNGAAAIELIERKNASFSPGQSGFWDHITFQVDDIDAMCKQLKEKNIKLIDQEPRLSLFGERILFFSGPDGERLELIENRRRI